MDDLKNIVFDIIKDENTELWFLLAEAEKESQIDNQSIVMSSLLKVLFELVRDGSIRVIDPNSGLIVSYDAEDNITLVNSFVKDIKHYPELGDGLWFASLEHE